MLSYLVIGPIDKRSEFDLFTLHSLDHPFCKMVVMSNFFGKTVLHPTLLSFFRVNKDKVTPTIFIKPWIVSYLDIGPIDKRSEFDLFTLHSLGHPFVKLYSISYTRYYVYF